MRIGVSGSGGLCPSGFDSEHVSLPPDRSDAWSPVAGSALYMKSEGIVGFSAARLQPLYEVVIIAASVQQVRRTGRKGAAAVTDVVGELARVAGAFEQSARDRYLSPRARVAAT